MDALRLTTPRTMSDPVDVGCNGDSCAPELCDEPVPLGHWKSLRRSIDRLGEVHCTLPYAKIAVTLDRGIRISSTKHGPARRGQRKVARNPLGSIIVSSQLSSASRRQHGRPRP